MKRTKVDRSKLRLNAETIRLLQPENLEQVNGGRCTKTGTSTWNDGLCTELCTDPTVTCPASYSCDTLCGF